MSQRFDRIVLHIAVAVATVGLGMILALLADLQTRFGFPDWGLGVITAASFVTAFAAYIWLSPFADRGYAGQMMIAGIIVLSLSMAWIGVASSLWQFVCARALVGLGGGLLVPAARRVALSWSDKPGQELGTIFAASIFGFVIGPVVGALIADAFGLKTPFFVAAGLGILMLPFIARITVPPAERVRTPGGVMSLLRNRMIAAGILVGAFDFFSIGALDAVLARLLTDLGASTTFIGLSFAVISLPLVVVAPIGGRIADRYQPLRVAVIASLFILPIVFLYGWVTALAGLLVVGGAHAVVSAVLAPAASATVATGSPKDRIAQGQGLLEAFGFLAAAVAAAIAGALYGALGAGGLFSSIAVGMMLIIGAAIAVGRPYLWPAPTSDGSDTIASP